MRIDELTSDIESSDKEIPDNLPDLYAEMEDPESELHKATERLYDPDRKYRNPNIDPENLCE